MDFLGRVLAEKTRPHTREEVDEIVRESMKSGEDYETVLLRYSRGNVLRRYERPPTYAPTGILHAPKGGVTINGKYFRGGEFVPKSDWSRATKDELDTLHSKIPAQKPKRPSERHGTSVRTNPPTSKGIRRVEKTYVRVDKEKQDWAEDNEGWLADEIDGVGLPNNECLDVLIHQENGYVGIEMKTLLVNRRGSVRMGRLARERKWEWEQGGKGRKVWTCVIDDREVFQTGDESKRRIFVRRGVGNMSIGAMLEVSSPQELRKLISTPDHRLPESARPIQRS